MPTHYKMDINKSNPELQGDPIISFGVISDVQFADLDNGSNFRGTRCRYYRNSLKQLQQTIEHWHSAATPVNFVLQLGDVIDGFNKRCHKSGDALDTILNVIKTSKAPFHHIWGNHEFYNFDRKFLLKSPLCTNPQRTNLDDVTTHNYYDFSPIKGFRVVLLDTYEVSILGYNPTHPRSEQAHAILVEHNPNSDLNSADGLCGLETRFRKFNGAVSHTQLCWIESVLEEARANSEHVIIAGHIPLLEASSDNGSLLWNFEEVLTILQKYSDVVAAYFCGHDHLGGYAQDACGIHHVTMPGVVETPPDSRAFATISVHTDGLDMRGHGNAKSLVIPFS